MNNTARYSATSSVRVARAACMLALALFAGAFSGGASAAGKNPCAQDVAQFCKGVERGGGRIARCLNQHAEQLSPVCRERIDAAKELHKELVEACKGDIEKQCRDVQPGGGRIARCLNQHEPDLTPKCRDKVDEAHDLAKQR